MMIVLIENQQHTQKQKKTMIIFNVDCSLSCDNSNMFVYTWTPYYDLEVKLTGNI